MIIHYVIKNKTVMKDGEYIEDSEQWVEKNLPKQPKK